MVPGRQDDAGVRTEFLSERKVVPQVEIDETGGVAKRLHDLVIRLHRHDREHAEHQRDQEPHRPRTEQRRQPVFLQHEPGGDARHQEQQRQPPRIEHQHQRLQRRDPVNALDVEPPGYVEHPDVVEDQKPEGGYPDPVEINPPHLAIAWRSIGPDVGGL